jgi:phosphate uptake regulator
MSNHIRKIQLVGNRSYAVSLPKKWIIENKIDKTKIVNIVESNNNLIISPNAITNNSVFKIEIKIHNIDLIKSIILLCYVKGLTQVTLIFTKEDQYLKSKKIINEILSHLEGFKINEESNKQVIINYYYNKYEINIFQLAKRKISIINQMYECIKIKDFQTKNILENEMDSLYHLSKRLLYLCSIDLEMRNNNKILDIEEIFLWRLIFKKIENLGDITVKLNTYKEEMQKEGKKLIEYINQIFIYQKKPDILIINTIKNKQYKEKYLEELKSLIIDILNNYLSIYINKEIFSE